MLILTSVFLLSGQISPGGQSSLSGGFTPCRHPRPSSGGQHTYSFFYNPVTQTRLDIPRPLITQSHRDGWTYQGLWLPSHTDTAGHTKAFASAPARGRFEPPVCQSTVTPTTRPRWPPQVRGSIIPLSSMGVIVYWGDRLRKQPLCIRQYYGIYVL